MTRVTKKVLGEQSAGSGRLRKINDYIWYGDNFIAMVERSCELNRTGCKVCECSLVIAHVVFLL